MASATVQVGFGDPIYPRGLDDVSGLSAAVESRIGELARTMLYDGTDSEDSSRGFGQDDQGDPFVTGRPYAYWHPPPEFESLDLEEQVRLLRSGKTHARG